MQHSYRYFLSIQVIVLLTTILLFASPVFCQENELSQLADLAWEQYEKRNLDSAIILGTKVLSLTDKNLTPNDTLLEQAVLFLGLYHAGAGEFPEAIKLWQRVILFREQRLGARHPDISITCHGIGNLYYWSGDFVEAERFYRKAMSIRIEAYGQNHYTVAANYVNLGILAFDQGDYTEAERLYRNGLEILKNTMEPGDREFAKSYNNLGELAAIRKDYQAALQWYAKAEIILKNTIGEMNSTFTDCLVRIGIAYRETSCFVIADSLFQKAIETAWIYNDGPHSLIANYSHELALLSWKRGAVDSALQQFASAIKMRELVGTGESLEQAKSWQAISQLMLAEGQIKLAFNAATKAVNINHDNFLFNSKILPERKSLMFSAALSNSVSNFIRIGTIAGASDNEIKSQVADVILNSKGRVSEVMFRRRSRMANVTDTIHRFQAENVERLRLKVSRLYVQGPGDDLKGHNKTLDSIQKLFREAESKLIREGYFDGYSFTYQDIDSKTLSDLIPPQTILIEYYQAINDIDSLSDNYYAVVLASDMTPLVLDLGSVAVIDSLVYKYRSHMGELSTTGRGATTSDWEVYYELAANLYKLIWNPIDKLIGVGDDVLISPDGTLNLLSFAGLIQEDGSYLLENRTLHYLSAARDISRYQKSQPHTAGLLAMGDPDYNASKNSTVSVAGIEPVTYQYAVRGAKAALIHLDEIVVSPLPSTKQEINDVARLWRKQTNEPANVYFGAEASEARFKRDAPGSRVIYLATHGYFLSDSYSISDTVDKNDDPLRQLNISPLLKSGLFFAGANRIDSEIQGHRSEDGVLTAYEVVGLNLSGTELVVLSACETGLGQISSGEGVYGLRRAFQVAGARTVMSTLWSISDQSTANLMSQIYLLGHNSLAKGLRKQQLDRLNNLRQQGLIDHPVDWAAFILVGDWHNQN